VIMNCREDRIARTQQFADDVLPSLPIDTLVVTGHSTRSVIRASQDGRIDARETLDLTGQDPAALAKALEGRIDGRVVLGVGNLHGGGREIIAQLEHLGVDPVTELGAA
jgi:gamma-polyglutamate synthase